MTQSTVSDVNASFWNDLCGSQRPKSIGVLYSSAASLKKFDDWHLDFYPYLFDHIPFSAMRNKDVLEIELCKGHRGVVGALAERERAAYDSGSSGEAAPHTDWISAQPLQDYYRTFSHFSATIENIDQEIPFRGRSQKDLLKTKWPSRIGLDLYATETK